jgi:hypothetical protein
MVLVQYDVNDATNLFKTFVAAYKGIRDIATCDWKDSDPTLTDLDCILLQYACRVGEMRNHIALAAHKDGNRCHAVKTMMLFGKIPGNAKGGVTKLAESLESGRLYLPFEMMALELRCGIDVLHCSFVNTYHVPDAMRGMNNFSFVHGP